MVSFFRTLATPYQAQTSFICIDHVVNADEVVYVYGEAEEVYPLLQLLGWIDNSLDDWKMPAYCWLELPEEFEPYVLYKGDIYVSCPFGFPPEAVDLAQRLGWAPPVDIPNLPPRRLDPDDDWEEGDYED